MQVIDADTTFDASQLLMIIKGTIEGCWNKYQDSMKLQTLGIQKIDDKTDYIMKILADVSITKALVILGGASQCLDQHVRTKTNDLKVNELNIILPKE